MFRESVLYSHTTQNISLRNFRLSMYCVCTLGETALWMVLSYMQIDPVHPARDKTIKNCSKS